MRKILSSVDIRVEVAEHHKDCLWRRSQTAVIPRCEHGRLECPICHACNCEEICGKSPSLSLSLSS